jgi:hypothetical protein
MPYLLHQEEWGGEAVICVTTVYTKNKSEEVQVK